MALIFFFSQQPDLSSGLGVWDLIGRKIFHAAEYALLCILWWRALAGTTTPGRALAAAAALSLAYAASDEGRSSGSTTPSASSSASSPAKEHSLLLDRSAL